jgi:lipopolysaccharide cholinephosphotransferase
MKKELSIIEVQKINSMILKNIVGLCEKHSILYFACFGTALGAARHNGFIPWDDDSDLCIPNDYIHKFIELAKKELSSEFQLFYGDSDSAVPYVRIGLKGFDTLTLHIDIYTMIGLPSKKKEQKKILNRIYGLSNIYTIKKTFKFNKNVSLYYLIKQLLIIIYLNFINPNRTLKKIEKLVFKYPYSKYNYNVVPFIKIYGNKKIFHKDIYSNGIKMCFEDFFINIPYKYDEYLTQIYGDYRKFPNEKHRLEMLKKIYVINKIK